MDTLLTISRRAMTTTTTDIIIRYGQCFISTFTAPVFLKYDILLPRRKSTYIRIHTKRHAVRCSPGGCTVSIVSSYYAAGNRQIFHGHVKTALSSSLTHYYYIFHYRENKNVFSIFT